MAVDLTFKAAIVRYIQRFSHLERVWIGHAHRAINHRYDQDYRLHAAEKGCVTEPLIVRVPATRRLHSPQAGPKMPILFKTSVTDPMVNL